MLCLLQSRLYAQVIDTTATDSITAVPPSQNQNLGNAGTTTQSQRTNLQEGQVHFQASDSLIFNLKGDRKADLFGSAKVTHESGELTSGKVSLNLDRNLVSASTVTPEDTLSQPVLVRQGDRIRSKSITFNYETERGRFEVARVQVSQGNLTGTKVKNTGPHTVFLEDAIYSTCTLDHPHYYIKANRMKVVDQEEVFFTNARLYILDIPYPIIFPFGYLPGNIQQKQSGLLQPTYVTQGQSNRSLGIQNLGWFQYFNDYIVGQASVDLYNSGTFFLDASTSYSNRNSYNGQVQIGYSRERGLVSSDPSYSVNTQKRLSINHNQEFSPYANMSANINLRTQDFFQRNSFDIDERVETSTSSSINYRYRHPENTYNFSISARQNQNFQTNITRLSGPSANFSLKQFSPFANNELGGRANNTWYENISVGYQNSFESNFNFDPIRADSAQINWFEALLNPGKYRKATGNENHYKYGFRQQANISMGSILPSDRINLSSGINYNEYWFPTTIRRTFNADSNRVEERQVRGFTTARDFSGNISLSTTVYGLMNKGIGNLESFRHTIRPSLSFSYRPDFSKDFWGYYKKVQVDSTGQTQEYSIFANEVFRGPQAGEQRSLGISIDNVFEAKQVRRDSTGEKKERTIRLIDRLNLRTDYNFAADSLKLSNLRASMSSSIIQKVNLRANANFNFYDRDSLGRKVDRFLLKSAGKPFEMVDFSLNASASFSGGKDGGVQFNDTHYPQNYDPFNQSIFNQFDSHFNQQAVQDIFSPWSVSLNFRYSWRLNPNGKNRKSATLNARQIQFRLTPKWSFSTRIGYDFIEKDLTPSQFSLNRKLHCWNLSFQMNPFGDFQYFSFRLSVDSGQIQSIFQKLPGLKNLERSSSPSGRGLRGRNFNDI